MQNNFNLSYYIIAYAHALIVFFITLDVKHNNYIRY